MMANIEGRCGGGSRKRGWESGQDQIWRNWEVGNSAQAEQDSVNAEHSLPSVILGKAASASQGVN